MQLNPVRPIKHIDLGTHRCVHHVCGIQFKGILCLELLGEFVTLTNKYPKFIVAPLPNALKNPDGLNASVRLTDTNGFIVSTDNSSPIVHPKKHCLCEYSLKFFIATMIDSS